MSYGVDSRVYIHVSWSPENNSYSKIRYYQVQIDNNSPVTTSNSSITLTTTSVLSANHSLRVWAVDMCDELSDVSNMFMTTSGPQGSNESTSTSKRHSEYQGNHRNNFVKYYIFFSSCSKQCSSSRI